MNGKRPQRLLNQGDERLTEERLTTKHPKRRSILIILAMVVALVVIASMICILLLRGQEDSIPPGIEVIFAGMGDRNVYHTLKEVEEEAGIIVEAVPRKVLGQEVDTVHFYIEEKNEVVESPSYGYTKLEVEVTRVYKGDVKVGDKLVFIHSYYTWTYSDGREVLYTLSSRKPEVKNKEYIMFLKYYEPFEGYCSVGDYEGVFPVPNAKMKRKVENGTVESSDLEVFDRDDMHYLMPIYTDMVKKYFID